MKKRISVMTACLLILVTALAGCGSNKQGSREDARDGAGSPINEAPAFSYKNDSAQDEAAYTADAAFSYTGTASATAYEKPKEESVEAGRKLVKTMSFSIETQDFERSTAEISAMVASLGGYVEDSSVSGSSYKKNDTRTATYVLRIPVSQLSDFSGDVEKIGNVISRSEKVRDITLDYTDTESHLKSLETQRDALIEMMSKAETLEDLLTIQDHLAGVQYELENYASRLRLYDNQVEYSSVSVKLQEVKIYTEPVVEPETFGERIAAAFKEGLEDAGEFFKDLVIFLAGSLPTLLLFALIIIVIIVLIRKGIKKRRAKKAAARANTVNAAKPADHQDPENRN